jgi:hypothetical protein
VLLPGLISMLFNFVICSVRWRNFQERYFPGGRNQNPPFSE